MKNKLLCETLEEFRLQEAGEPLAIAVLGAPAGGKGFTMNNIKKSVKDARIADTIKSGMNLSVDTLRSELQSKNAEEQLDAFVKAFYHLKGKAIDNPTEYGKWFKDIQNIWRTKLNELMPGFKITVDDEDLKFNGKPAIECLDMLKDPKLKSVIDKLDNYIDYKRVVRYFQHAKQDDAIDKQINVSYDESGDEPQKIIHTLKRLHDKGYVTDVFLIHPENIATNLIQNYFRVLTGGDEGRDSYEAMINAYLDIEKTKGYYEKNAEDTLETTSKELQKKKMDPKIGEPLEKANVEDDPPRGDKPIDVFTEIHPMKPITAFNTFNKQLNTEQRLLFLAILKYRMLSIPNLPDNAKKVLNQITKGLKNNQALNILKKGAASKKYIYKYGGITPELVKKAETILK